MHCVQNITQDILFLGASDRRLALFENVFPIPRGISYNSYLVKDEKTILLDTADNAVGERFLENLDLSRVNAAGSMHIVLLCWVLYLAIHAAVLYIPTRLLLKKKLNLP